MKVGIIVGSVRETRRGEHVGRWVSAIAAEHDDVEFDLIDLVDFDLPFATAATLPTMAGGHYDDARVTAWSERIGSVDAFVFITAEYNHGIPGAFKNAVDLLAPEWAGKCVGFVSYGAVGGVRAVEQWRQVLANFSMVDIRSQVTLSNFTDFEPDGAVSPATRHSENMRALLQELVAVHRRLHRD